jgi:hypothetical protein
MCEFNDLTLYELIISNTGYLWPVTCNHLNYNLAVSATGCS